MKQCPGDGCHNTIPAAQDMCGSCRVKAQQEQARISLWANEGLKALGAYLTNWAAFEERYGPN